MKRNLIWGLLLVGACASNNGSPYYKVENDKVVTYRYKKAAADCPHANTTTFESVSCGERLVRRTGISCLDCGTVTSETRY